MDGLTWFAAGACVGWLVSWWQDVRWWTRHAEWWRGEALAWQERYTALVADLVAACTSAAETGELTVTVNGEGEQEGGERCNA